MRMRHAMCGVRILQYLLRARCACRRCGGVSLVQEREHLPSPLHGLLDWDGVRRVTNLGVSPARFIREPSGLIWRRHEVVGTSDHERLLDKRTYILRE